MYSVAHSLTSSKPGSRASPQVEQQVGGQLQPLRGRQAAVVDELLHVLHALGQAADVLREQLDSTLQLGAVAAAEQAANDLAPHVRARCQLQIAVFQAQQVQQCKPQLQEGLVLQPGKRCISQGRGVDICLSRGFAAPPLCPSW